MISREDRRRGYIGKDYGEDDDEVDYSKKYDDDVSLLTRRPKGDRRYRTIGESIILGAAAAAATADHHRRNTPQLVRVPAASAGYHHQPPTRIITNHFDLHNQANNSLADCLETSMHNNVAAKNIRTNKRWYNKYCPNPSYWLAHKFKSRAKRIDILARIIFPLVFAIFNLSYWSYYLILQATR